MGGSLVAISAPVYWLGPACRSTCSPTTSASSRSSRGRRHATCRSSQDPANWFQSLILPWLVLAASFAAIYARLLRGNLIETMSEDYIRTARAKGLSERRVVLRHGVRSAITPIVTAARPRHRHPARRRDPHRDASSTSPASAASPTTRSRTADLPMIQGTVLFGAFFIIFANLVVDIALRVPRPAGEVPGAEPAARGRGPAGPLRDRGRRRQGGRRHLVHGRAAARRSGIVGESGSGKSVSSSP